MSLKLKGVTYSRIQENSWEKTAYEVFLYGQFVGIVRSQTQESWRTLSSGVRYSKRGEPTVWGFDEPKREGATRTHFNYNDRKSATRVLLDRQNIEYEWESS